MSGEERKFKGTINDDTFSLRHIYNEDTQSNWQDDAQAMIDYFKKKGVRAQCIHEGPRHALYVEKKKFK